MVDYSKWDKMTFSSSDEEDIDKHTTLKSQTRMNGNKQLDELTSVLSDQTSWFKCLSVKERYEWFVDCYRMRLDDDYVWGGSDKLRGLYLFDPSGNCDALRDTVVKDFLVFMKLAMKHGVIPKTEVFSFGECLKEAAIHLPYAFEKSDAKEKWGGENVFSTRPSLRRTAEAVYGCPCGTVYDGKSIEESLQEMIDKNNGDYVDNTVFGKMKSEVERGVRKDFQKSSKVLFKDVGGFELWDIFYNALRFIIFR